MPLTENTTAAGSITNAQLANFDILFFVGGTGACVPAYGMHVQYVRPRLRWHIDWAVRGAGDAGCQQSGLVA